MSALETAFPNPTGEPVGSDEISGTGRHLTGRELQAWTGFLDASRMLERVLAQHLSTRFGMSHREYEVLVRLDGAGGRQRMSVLATQIVASAPLITQTVRRLEQRGWVSKQAVPDDLRGVDAVLEPAGRRALETASGEHAALIKELLLDRIGRASLPEFADAIKDVADHFRGHAAGHDCDSPDCSLR